MKKSSVPKQGSSARKKKKPTYKIRWDLMGLAHPDAIEKTPSMDAIRSEVSFLATQRLSVRAQAPSAEQAKGHGRKQTIPGRGVRRA